MIGEMFMKRREKQYYKKINFWMKNQGLEIFLSIFLLIVVLIIVGKEIRLLRTDEYISEIISKGIDYEAFRDIKINENILEESDINLAKLLEKHPSLQGYAYVDPIGYLTFTMLAKNYNPEASGYLDDYVFLRGIADLVETEAFRELYEYYGAIINDLQYFPVPYSNKEEAHISYENSWFSIRNYGGKRRHEGTDIMTETNQRGLIPVVSMTDGIIEKMGWLEKGGYRIGIRSPSSGYFYYAHLDSYAPNLQEGDQVIAGQMLGFMGDSGYGEEGTVGEFPVHLHLGIYISSRIGEMSVNPYNILKILENYRISYIHNE